MHEFNNDAIRTATIEKARAEAQRSNKAQVVGFHSWSGWTVEAADNTWAVAELGDVVEVPVPTTSIEEDIEERIGDILARSSGQTDVIYFRDFKNKVDAYLKTLSDSDKEIALSQLRDPEADWPYYEETHDFDKEPFDAQGRCYHGLTWMTCPCGCGELPRPEHPWGA